MPKQNQRTFIHDIETARNNRSTDFNFFRTQGETISSGEFPMMPGTKVLHVVKQYYSYGGRGRIVEQEHECKIEKLGKIGWCQIRFKNNRTKVVKISSLKAKT